MMLVMIYLFLMDESFVRILMLELFRNDFKIKIKKVHTISILTKRPLYWGGDRIFLFL